MKTKTLLFTLVLFTGSLFNAAAANLLISEDFSSAAWADEFLRIDPTYVKPAPKGNFGVINTAAYFDKYYMEGAVVTFDGLGVIDALNTTNECALFASEGIVHSDVDNLAVAFRFRNSATSIFECPEIASAGIVTLHVRNGNSTDATTLSLEKYVDGVWTNVYDFPIQGHGAFSATTLDEVVTYDVNSAVPIKLRVSRGTKFINLFRIDIAAYETTGLKSIESNPFKLMGRKLVTEQPTEISVYNASGALLFQKAVETEIELPATLKKGFYFIKSQLGSQKIILE